VTDDHALRNRASWDADADNWVERGRRAWSAEEITWGIWSVPESEWGVLPDVDGLDAVELGCGTGYVSAWLSRRGARPVGLDNSFEQLSTARRLQEEFDRRFPLVHADAEHTPFRDESFDVAISEYGAAIWCDPYVWIPEAARILRPGGRLVFLGHSPLVMLAVPDEDGVFADERLRRDQFGLHRFDWGDVVEFAIPHGEMIRLLCSSGFVVEDLIEIRAGEDASSDHADWVTPEWARRWPTEDVWRARKAS
jgi:SAM-dependent methyltransferase